MAYPAERHSERAAREPVAAADRGPVALVRRVGQLVTVCFVYLVLGFPLPFGICLALIALSAWLNVFLRIRYPARTRLNAALATCLLAYDILELAALLYLTGGVENPFTFLLVAPVTVSAATLPPRNTIALGVLAARPPRVLLVFYRLRCRGTPSADLDLPTLYKLGLLASVLSGMSSWRSTSGGWPRSRGR